MKHALRLLALASTTLCTIFFLGNAWMLVEVYNYSSHRFPPFIKPGHIALEIVLGVGALGSGILYRLIVRNMRQNSK
jgi:hypothetical protein